MEPPQGSSLFSHFDLPQRRRRGSLVAAAAGVVALLAAFAFLFGGKLRPAAPAEEAQAAPEIVDAARLTGPRDAAPRLADGPRPISPVPDSAIDPTVVLRLHVDETGRVADAKVYRKRPELAAFEQAALAAARHYTFSPGRRDGVAVPVWLNLPITFAAAVEPTTVLRIKGSDTIGAALAPALAASWRTRNPSTAFEIEALGSGTAFPALLGGSADIGVSSRAVNARELEQAHRQGATLREFVIGYDGIAVITHARNPVSSLTVDQLAAIFTGAVRSWEQVGGDDAPIHLIGRPAHSGTHAFFKERVIRKGNSKGAEEFAAGIDTVEHSADLVARVAADPLAISYAGLGWVSPEVGVVAVAPRQGAPAVLPSASTVAEGRYPIYRPLMAYTLGTPRGELASFLRFVLSDQGRRIVAEHDFVASDVPAELLLPADDPPRPVPAGDAAVAR